jgi:hypothetical protein
VRRIVVVVAAAGALSFALVACGSAKLDAADFAKSANAICHDLRVQSARRLPGITDPAAYYGTAAEIEATGRSNLSGLRSPPEVRVRLDAMLAAIDAHNEALVAAAKAARNADTKARAALEKRLPVLQQRIYTAARALALSECVGVAR